MITEDYVSFETAKLLKEKGFDGECDLFGRTDDSELIIYEAGKIAYNQGIDDECVILPTLQMAMKWLRKVYDIKVNIFYSNPNYAIEYFEPNTQTGVGKFVFIGDGYKSFEQACEAAIKYCLENLI